MSLLEKILKLDRELFIKINSEWNNPVFDFILPYLRNALTWLPVYIFLLVFMPVNYKKNGWIWVLAAVVTGACTDLISSRLIKENIFRLRPCHVPDLAQHIRFLVSYCPGSSSFTSSHAVNHFGLSMFIFTTLRRNAGKWLTIVFLWAFAICYAQVYVGVHYPLDVTAGAIVGMAIGYTTGRVFDKNYGLK